MQTVFLNAPAPARKASATYALAWRSPGRQHVSPARAVSGASGFMERSCRRTLLLVEDDPVNQVVACLAQEKPGFRAKLATDRQEATRQIRRLGRNTSGCRSSP